MDNADAPIRYRVQRELLKNEKAAKQIEELLLDNEMVKQWLKKLNLENYPQRRNICEMAHGGPDYHLENSMQKIVQLGLHAEMPPVAEAVQNYINVMTNTPLKKPYRKDAIGHYKGLDFVIPANMLTLGGFRNSAVLEFMLGSLDEMYAFAGKGDCNIYLSSEDRAKLKGVPPNWADVKHFIKPELFDEFGLCWPMIYDIIGLTKLYGAHSPETDRKIDVIIDFITNDNFHKTIPDGYGILIAGKRKYHSHGWDPKYPGWFDVADYIKTATGSSSATTLHPSLSVSKLLFFAMYIAKYPIALKTKWFSDLLCCLEKYKTENGTYEFPKEWLMEKQGYTVMGYHMSFGESRRKRNWREIESTFYMQLLGQSIQNNTI
jgi:hypothetical protein